MKTDNRNRGHLTAKEISRWLVEGPPQSAAQHVQNCWTCQAKLAEVQGPLTAFRTALVNWSEADAAGQPLTLQAPSTKSEGHWGLRLWLPAASFALAALLLVGYAKVPGWFPGHSSGRQRLGLTSISTTDSDAVLMDQVDTEVSEAVPDAMAPLTDLVAWDSSEVPEAKTAATEKGAVHKKSTTKAHVPAPD